MADQEIKSVDDMRKWLQPTDYLSPGNEYMKHLNSYVSGTGDWLRQSEDFRRWRSGHEDGCLWVKGVPGSGKSVFAASTIQQLQTKVDGSTPPVLYFFFRQIVEKNHDPLYLVRDWAAQLLPFSPYLQSKLSSLSKQRAVVGTEMTDLWEMLEVAMKKLDMVYCVADALDEMDNEFMYFIDRLKALGSAKTDSIKVLTTSRPVVEIENVLRSSAVVSQKLDPTFIYPDILKYAGSRLDSLETSIAPARRLLVEEAICQRSAGLFLYARLTMDSLYESLQNGTITEDQLPAALADLPLDLPSLYTRMLAEHARRSHVTQQEQLTIVQCVIQSSRPLRLIELGSIIAQIRQDYTIEGLREGKQLVRDSCGRLLEILDDESVSVIHHSFTEFIRSQEEAVDCETFPVLSQQEAQILMVRVCLQYLDSCEPSIWIKNLRIGQAVVEDVEDVGTSHEERDEEENHDYYDPTDEYDDRNNRYDSDDKREAELRLLRLRYPLLEYATKNLNYHMDKIYEGTEELHSLLDKYFRSEKSAFDIWAISEWSKYRFRGLQALHVAARLGWTSYVGHLLAQGVNIEARDGEGYTPLLYAVSLTSTISLHASQILICMLQPTDIFISAHPLIEPV